MHPSKPLPPDGNVSQSDFRFRNGAVMLEPRRWKLIDNVCAFMPHIYSLATESLQLAVFRTDPDGLSSRKHSGEITSQLVMSHLVSLAGFPLAKSHIENAIFRESTCFPHLCVVLFDTSCRSSPGWFGTTFSKNAAVIFLFGTSRIFVWSMSFEIHISTSEQYRMKSQGIACLGTGLSSASRTGQAEPTTSI